MDVDRCELLCLDLPKAEALRTGRLEPDVAAKKAAEAGALADPTRLMIAAALAEGGELCVCDLAWVAERAENLVSHHLRVLREAGLVASSREGKMVLYELTDRGRGLLEGILSEKARV
jgi:DNA-binding transcriptional ArsR family regulator